MYPSEKDTVLRCTTEPMPGTSQTAISTLTGTRTLLVLDNLETLTDTDQRSLFAFLGHLPRSCKALLTSRPLVIATGRRLKLQQFDQTTVLKLPPPPRSILIHFLVRRLLRCIFFSFYGVEFALNVSSHLIPDFITFTFTI